MNILYLAHRIPYPPNKGDKIRSFHQIQHLSRRNTLHLACLVDEKEDLQHVEILKKYCTSVDAVYRNKTVTRLLAASALLTNKPLSVVPFYSRELQKRIDQRLASMRPDRILVFSSAMAEYVRHVSDIPKVIDFVDLDSVKWRLYANFVQLPLSWIYRLEAARLGLYEKEAARAFDHSIVVSEEEASLFKQRVNDRFVSVIPNGVDLDYFAPNGDGPSSSHNPVIVFMGEMDYFPNVDAVRYFCGEMFPRIRMALPEARFYIIGRNPSRPVKKLQHQTNVIVTGSVIDIRPYLAKASVAVAPLRIARGIQNKVLEAMAMGLPVVGTSVAFQGTEATVADGIRIADDPKEFSNAVLMLLQDSRLQQQCSLCARDYVQRRHRWQDHNARLEFLLHEMTVEPPSRFGLDRPVMSLG